MTREVQLVELVDDAGTPCGEATVAEAHRAPGLLHRAFSVLLVDPEGRTLVQQRSADKTRFPLRWANTCCGHPAPGQPVVDAAARRLLEELSVRHTELVPVGVHVYAATDPVTGRVEREYDHVLVGRVDAALEITPNPAEVAAVRWVPPVELRTDVVARPDAYAPWLIGVLRLLS